METVKPVLLAVGLFVAIWVGRVGALTYEVKSLDEHAKARDEQQRNWATQVAVRIEQLQDGVDRASQSADVLGHARGVAIWCYGPTDGGPVECWPLDRQVAPTMQYGWAWTQSTRWTEALADS
jgi:hypothetical protein